MANRSRQLVTRLALDTDSFTRGFQRAERTAGQAQRRMAGSSRRAATSLERDNRRASGSFSQLSRRAIGAGAGVAGAYLTISKAQAAVSATESLAKTSLGLARNLGLTTREASRWAAVATARGVDGKALTMSFTALSRQAEQAAGGSEKARRAFRNLGIDQRDLARGQRDFSGLVGQVADGLGRMEGGTKRQATAQALLGRGYQTLLPMFAQGSKGLREQQQLADRYGVTLTDKTIGPIKEMIARQRELKIANLGLQVQFTQALTPSILKVEDAFLRVLRVYNDPKLTDEEKWDRIGKSMGRFSDEALKQFEVALPKMADAAARQAPKVAAAFIGGFWNTSVWGRLA
ncbi:MAG: hypothetical protein ACR2ML_06165, partial [Solirubrobacteraceae bacterium]